MKKVIDEGEYVMPPLFTGDRVRDAAVTDAEKMAEVSGAIAGEIKKLRSKKKCK